jgi:hypothetical protein
VVAPQGQAGWDYAGTLRRIAESIEALKGEYPQLAGFSVEEHFYPDRLTIAYDHRTYWPRRRAGWAGSVPNPHPDGIWFHLDFHDPGSTSQIHTQPVVPKRRYGEKQVMLLILEGKDTRSLQPALDRILQRHGVR